MARHHTPKNHSKTDDDRSAEPQLGVASHRGWYTRGYLPHYDAAGLYQFVTYRLADSLPVQTLKRIIEDTRRLPSDLQSREQWKRIEEQLDAGHGGCALRYPEVARCVIDTWRQFDPDRYGLLAWVVMPNHVHVLIRQRGSVALSQIIQSWKSYTGRTIAEILRRAGARRSGDTSPIWMREYRDRFIRDERHLRAAINYIHFNPVKARLVEREEDWPWSSACRL